MWKAILAAMLFLQAPGKSIYSQVEVPQNASPPCDDEYSLLCSPPRWSEAHGAYTVAENWEQGLRRYSTIARALDDVVAQERWKSPRSHLWRYTLAFAYHESGFRRDVHSGVGSASRGDCRWHTTKNGERERIPGSCRSHCLAQIMLGPKNSFAKTSEGYKPTDLTGTDYDSTKRCMEVAVRIIDGAYQFCARRGPKPLSYCIVTHYAGGMVPNTDRRVVARVKTVNKLWHAPTTLEDEVREALGITDPGKPNKVASTTASAGAI